MRPGSNLGLYYPLIYGFFFAPHGNLAYITFYPLRFHWAFSCPVYVQNKMLWKFFVQQSFVKKAVVVVWIRKGISMIFCSFVNISWFLCLPIINNTLAHHISDEIIEIVVCLFTALNNMSLARKRVCQEKVFLEDGTEIDDNETFKVCANDIFVFSCDGQRWNTVLSSQPQGSKFSFPY